MQNPQKWGSRKINNPDKSLFPLSLYLNYTWLTPRFPVFSAIFPTSFFYGSHTGWSYFPNIWEDLRISIWNRLYRSSHTGYPQTLRHIARKSCGCSNRSHAWWSGNPDKNHFALQHWGSGLPSLPTAAQPHKSGYHKWPFLLLSYCRPFGLPW